MAVDCLYGDMSVSARFAGKLNFFSLTMFTVFLNKRI